MLNVPVQVRIHLAPMPVETRKSFDRLSAQIQKQLQLNPLSGHLFVFRNKSGDKIKLLFWDRNSFVLWYKRLEKGRFKWPRLPGASHVVTAQELELLLDGIDISKLGYRHYPLYK